MNECRYLIKIGTRVLSDRFTPNFGHWQVVWIVDWGWGSIVHHFLVDVSSSEVIDFTEE